MRLNKHQIAFLTLIRDHAYNTVAWLAADGNPPTKPLQVLPFVAVSWYTDTLRISSEDYNRIADCVEPGVAREGCLMLTDKGKLVLEAMA